MDRQACHSSRPLIPNETAQHGFTSRVESFAGEVEATAIGADRSKLHVTPPAAVPAHCVGPGIVIARELPRHVPRLPCIDASDADHHPGFVWTCHSARLKRPHHDPLATHPTAQGNYAA